MSAITKFAAFSVIGLSAIVGNAALEQDDFYHENIFKPTSVFQEKLGIATQKLQVPALELPVLKLDSSQASETFTAFDSIKIPPLDLENGIPDYKNWLQENMEFIKNLPTNEKDYKKTLAEINTVIKDNSNYFDKLAVALMEIGEKVPLLGMDTSKKSLAMGMENHVLIHDTIHHNGTIKTVGTELFVGINFFEKSDTTFRKNLGEVFNNDKKLIFDYVIFHELGHILSASFNGKDGKNDQMRIEEIISQFEAQKKERLSQKDKDMIGGQYREGVADVIAVQLLGYKYPNLQGNYKEKLAKARYKSNSDSEHRTTFALLSHIEGSQNNKIASLENILSESRQASLNSAAFYSHISFVTKDQSEKRGIPVHLAGSDNLESTRKLLLKLANEIYEEKNLSVKRNIGDLRVKFNHTVEEKKEYNMR